MLVVIALTAVALAAAPAAHAAPAPRFTLAATEACLKRLPEAVAGLPPARPPVPWLWFVYAPAHDDWATGSIGPQPQPHRQLGVWTGGARYEGILLSFFKTADAARVSLKTLASLYGGERIGNVVATWDGKPAPSAGTRSTVFGCLRSHGVAAPARAVPPATRATFTGYWGGHTRGLAISTGGDGKEDVDDGCCMRVYQLTFRVVSVSGTVTHATAVYRLTTFRPYDKAVPKLRVGQTGTLVLRNGIVTNTLTGVYFCSDPAWSATGACGA